MSEPEKRNNDWIEEIEVTGSELISRVKELIKEGNVRHIVIRNQQNDVVLEIPLATGIAVGGVVAFFSLPLAALGALAALVTRLKIEVVRQAEAQSDEADSTTTARKKRIRITSDEE